MDQIQSIVGEFLGQISVDHMAKLADDTLRFSMEDLANQIGADAAAIWVQEVSQPDQLTIAINVGARGSEVEGGVSQNLDSGLVSKAFNDNCIVHDEGAFRHSDQSMDVDMQLGQMTNFQLAGPFHLFGKCVGAVTAVQITTPDNISQRKWGYQEEDESLFRRWLTVAERLVEWKLVQGREA